MGPTQPPVQWLLGAVFTDVKRPGREADNLPLAGVRVTMSQAIPAFPHMPAWHAQGKLCFTIPVWHAKLCET